VTPTIYCAGALRLSLFSTMSHFSTPRDVTLDDFKIELFFPADEATKAALHAFSASSCEGDASEVE
ncbi:MAG: hypothetical protein AAFN13_13665, partial [Bacteroidota bacterium]